MNLIIYPLKIAIPTVPVLPHRYSYILTTTEKKIVGVTLPLETIPSESVYVSIASSDAVVTNNITDTDNFPQLPRFSDISSIYEDFWYDFDKPRTDICSRILDVTSGVVSNLIRPVPYCFKNTGRLEGSFDEEKYVSFFLPEGQKFAKHFLQTKMMKVFIEKSERGFINF